MDQAMCASTTTHPQDNEDTPVAPAGSGRRHYRTGSERKSNFTGYLPLEVKKQLRLLDAERDTSVQNLLTEALNDLFAKNGKPEIAPLDER